MNNLIEIKIKNFRAINSAEIALNGITVVTGENGCGKSTISKLLYQTYKVANNFESSVRANLRIKSGPHFQRLQEISEKLNRLNREKKEESILYKKLNGFWRHIILDDLEKIKFQLERIIDELKFEIRELSDESSIRLSERLYHFTKDEYGIISSEESDKINILGLVDKLFNDIIAEIENSMQELEERPLSSYLSSEIQQLFHSSKLPDKFEILESSSPLVDWELDRLNKSYLIKEQVYIDTPMAAGLEVYKEEYSHWNDLNNLLKKAPGFNSDEQYNPVEYLKDEVFNGDISLNTNQLGFSNGFVYKRKDGLEIDLLDCATGLKSFAILQLLLKNGTLTKDTLVIIDEPEAHLHPQWVVEYARLIVLLNKLVGTKFFIASHHPNMVSAIKDIYEKEKGDNKLNIYFGVKVADTFTYDYKHLGQDIETVFESFSIALDRINLYGGE